MIGATLEQLEAGYGPAIQTDRYRPDLYPASYGFDVDGAKVDATLIDGRSLYLAIKYAKAPAVENVGTLLARFSGLPAWTEQPATDPSFEKYFPLFNPARGTFLAAQGRAFALVQRNVGLGELVLWLSAAEYPERLLTYRAERREDSSPDS